MLNFGQNDLISNIKSLNLSSKNDLVEASHNFYNFINILDQTECKTIAVAPIPNHGLGKTINDRLKEPLIMMNEKILQDFISIVGIKNIITNSKDLEKYNKDWRGFYNNKCLGILFPENSEIIKKITKYCFENNIKNCASRR